MTVAAASLTLSGPSAAQVTAVRGSAFGYFARVSLFGGPLHERGPAPTVELPPGGSAVPITASQPSGLVQFGPAILLRPGPITVSTQGTTGPGGSVTTSSDIQNVDTSGQGVFTATRVLSSCTSSETGVSGSTTISGGTLRLSEGNPDVEGDEVVVTLPTNPAPNTEYAGQIEGVGDRFRYIFNEQIPSEGGITVNAAHLYLLGPSAVGELVIGQVVCGVTAVTTTTTPTTTPNCTITGSGDIVGTEGDDVICGSAGPDRISGLGGDDVIYGFGGDDQLSGGNGNDLLVGGDGIDRLAGGDGDDTLNSVDGVSGDYASGSNHMVGDTCDRDPGDFTATCETVTTTTSTTSTTVVSSATLDAEILECSSSILVVRLFGSGLAPGTDVVVNGAVVGQADASGNFEITTAVGDPTTFNGFNVSATTAEGTTITDRFAPAC